MLKINIIAVGKVKEKYFEDGIKEYLKRLSRFAEVKIYEVKEENFNKDSEEIRNITIKKEGENILPLMKGYIFCLAIEGKQLSSIEFSKKIEDIKTQGISEISFVIGGSYGLDSAVKNRADFLFSFSKMTFPHTLFRLMLTEQIYRAFMINGGGAYHK